MKKLLLIILSIFFITPVYAKEYTVQTLGLNIDIPDEYVVATRDNLNEIDYSNLGTNADELNTLFNNNSIYLETLDDKNGVTLFIRAIENPGIDSYTLDANTDSDALSIAKKAGVSEFKTIKTDQFKLIEINYTSNSKELVEYYLSWKDLFITITAQATDSTLSDATKSAVDDIVKTLTLTGEGKITTTSETTASSSDNKSSTYLNQFIFILVIAVVIIIYIYRKKNKK
jgi:hypothetical protein